MSGLYFKGLSTYYVVTTLFPNSYYSLNPKRSSLIAGIENFESYPWGIDVHEELLSGVRIVQGQPGGNWIYDCIWGRDET